MGAKRYGLYLCPGARLLETVEDYTVTRLQSLTDQPIIADCPHDLDDSRFYLVPFSNNHDHGVTLRITGNPTLRNQDRLVIKPFFKDGLDKHTGEQHGLGVRENRTYSDRTSALINHNLAEFEGA